MDDRQYKDRLRAYAGDALGRRLFSDTEPRDTIPDLCAEIEHLRRELKGAKERSAQDWGRITSPDPTELEIEQHVEIERLCSEIAAMKALANGYVKLADDEMIVKQLKTGEVCFGTVNVDQVARKFGYIKLEPGQEIIERRILNALIDDHCVGCMFFEAEERDCATCDLKPIRDRIKEARDE